GDDEVEIKLSNPARCSAFKVLVVAVSKICITSPSTVASSSEYPVACLASFQKASSALYFTKSCDTLLESISIPLLITDFIMLLGRRLSTPQIAAITAKCICAALTIPLLSFVKAFLLVCAPKNFLYFFTRRRKSGLAGNPISFIQIDIRSALKLSL